MNTNDHLQQIVALAEWIPLTGKILHETDATRLLVAIDRYAKYRRLACGSVCAHVDGNYHLGLVPTIETMFRSPEEFALEIGCLLEHLSAPDGAAADKSREGKSKLGGIKAALGKASQRSQIPVAIQRGTSKLEGQVPQTKARDVHVTGTGAAKIIAIGAKKIQARHEGRTIDVSINYSHASAKIRGQLIKLISALHGDVEVTATDTGAWTVEAADLLQLLHQNLYSGYLETIVSLDVV